MAIYLKAQQPPITKHTELTDKEVGSPGVINHGNGSVTWEKLAHALKDVIDGKTTLAEVLANADIADAIAKRHDGAAQDAAIAGKADLVHAHAIADVVNLLSALAGKLDKPLAVETFEKTASRAFNTIYQNTTGKALLVSISWARLEEHCTIFPLTGPSSPPTTSLKATTASTSLMNTRTFLVEPGYYYEVVIEEGEPQNVGWIEQTLG